MKGDVSGLQFEASKRLCLVLLAGIFLLAACDGENGSTSSYETTRMTICAGEGSLDLMVSQGWETVEKNKVEDPLDRECYEYLLRRSKE